MDMVRPTNQSWSDPSAATGTPAACTIIARNYLSHAAVLAESYLKHEPGARFYLLVVDELPQTVVPDGVHLIGPDELGLPSFFEMCFKYNVTELCTAVKPAFLSLLLTRYGERSVIYLDPDILVMRPLDKLKTAMRSADIVLIPHLLDPIPRDGLMPSEQDILVAGAYNLGFLALTASEVTKRLLAWWADRLEDGCRVDTAHGLFVDQRWMDLVPGLFPSTTVLRDETYDVAYWNLHSRMPERSGSEFLVGDRPLAFFHFSGFDPREPQTLSRHQSRTIVQKGSALAELLELYADLHRTHGHAVSSRWPYGYSRFSNGVTVSPVFRRLYLGLSAPNRRVFGDPFRAHGPASFFHWATRLHAESGALNPFLEMLYQIRSDLPIAFPDAKGKDREAFLQWARLHGAREMEYPPDIVPSGEAAVESAGGVAVPESPPEVAGVNVAGYLRNETGIGFVARGYVGALRSLGVSVALKDFSALSPNRSEDPTLAASDEVHPHPVNLVCANADQYFVVASHLGDGFFRNRRNIGVWFWELPEFPTEWHDRFPHFDELWAPSSFIANTLATVSPIPIVRMPAVLTDDATGVRDRGRARLGVGPREFIWLFVFDFHSYFERKNPLDLIAAFRKAFTPSDPVRLVIKTVNSTFNKEAFLSMQDAARTHRISIDDGYWPLHEMRDLFAACDGYASLHRSEGLGVPLASAMLHGKPVVATDWSGNRDFMNLGNSFPIRYDLVRLASDIGPYRAGGMWAEPSVDHAAQLLRLVVEGGEEVAAKSEMGRKTIETEYSVEAVARCMKKRLAVIGGQLVGGRSSSSSRVMRPANTATVQPANAATLPPASDDLIPVLPALDLQTSQHGWWGRWGKRAAGFLLRYHSFHQQRVNAMLAGSIGDLAARHRSLLQRLDRADPVERQDRDATARAIAVVAARADQVVARLERVEAEAARIFDEVAANRKVQREQATAAASSLRSVQGRIESIDAFGAQTAVEVQKAHEQIEAAARSLCWLESRLQQVSGRLDRLSRGATRADETALAVQQALGGLDGLRSQSTRADQLIEALTERLEQIAAKVSQIGFRFAVRPYMGIDPFGATGDLSRPMGYGLETSRAGVRPRFEDIFRGPEDLVAARQREYLKLLDGISPVVDLGCGRGEFLGLLAPAGIRGVGVEKDPSLVARCRARGLRVVTGDALQYLQTRPKASLGAIFSAQFIEHLTPKDLVALLALSRTRLRKGGLFIAETPNPESFEALKTFHVDLTHQKPIYPQVLLQMCLEGGFESARIFYPLGGGFTQQQYESAGEFAVVAAR